MKKLFCLAVLSCFSFVGCGPAAPVTKPADSSATGTMSGAPATAPTEGAPTEAPKETAPPADTPK